MNDVLVLVLSGDELFIISFWFSIFYGIRRKECSANLFCWLTRFNPLQPSVAFLYPLKTSEKPKGFLMFSGVIEKQHQDVMG